MKKTLATLLALLSVCGFTACEKPQASESTAVLTEPPITETEEITTVHITAEPPQTTEDVYVATTSAEPTPETPEPVVTTGGFVPDGPFDIMTSNIESYIDVSAYKGIKVGLGDVLQIDDHLVDSEVARRICALPDDVMIHDRAAVSGDTVNIDVDSINDIEFENQLVSDLWLVLGSGTMVSGFENCIVGMTPGETSEFSVVFPDDYNEMLAGKEVVFSITLNYICPTLTDEIAITHFDAESAYAFRETVRFELAVAENNIFESAKETATWTAVLSAARVIRYPSSLIEEEYNKLVEKYKAEAEQNGVTYEELFVSVYGMTMDEAEAMLTEAANFFAKQRLAIYAIARDMHIDVQSVDEAALYDKVIPRIIAQATFAD